MSLSVPVSWSFSSFGLLAEPTVLGRDIAFLAIGLGNGEVAGRSPGPDKSLVGLLLVLPPVCFLVRRLDDLCDVIDLADIGDGCGEVMSNQPPNDFHLQQRELGEGRRGNEDTFSFIDLRSFSIK